MQAVLLKSGEVEAESRQWRLIAALADPRRYPQPVSRVQHLETHISHVLLAGNFAYKIKKPVSLGFLDFSDLHARRYYCEEELRLNRRTAPGLYLEVIPICGSEDEPILNGNGTAIEYALKMRRFSQNALFSKLLERGELTDEHIESLAANIAEFHGEIEIARDADPFGAPRLIEQPARQNFDQLARLLPDRSEELEQLRRCTERAHSDLAKIFSERKRQGFIRECHGDLHLDNITLFDGEITLFDCVEFNVELHWIDVMSDVAFVMMDLCVRGQDDFAFRLLNAYLEHTGDYSGVAVLRYYLVYRALVRAKVMALRDARQEAISAYLSLARRLAFAAHPALIITHGVSGSGKSALAQSLLEDLAAIRVRSDVERKRLFGFGRRAATASLLAQGLYSSDSTVKTYDRLEQLARDVINAGFPVVVDAANLKRAQRDRFRNLAAALAVPFVILDCRAPTEALRERIARRADAGSDPSEADLSVLEHQFATREPLSPDELSSAVVFESGNDWKQQLFALKSRLGLSGEEREPIGNL